MSNNLPIGMNKSILYTGLISLTFLLAGCGGSDSDTDETVEVAITVTDGDSDSTTENAAPVADAGGSYSGLAGETISLSAAASSDSDGSIESYAWDLDQDGSFDDAFGISAEYSASTAGTYTISLQVTDDSGATDTDSTTVSVTEESASLEGYNLFGNFTSTTSYLMDNYGNTVHTWDSDYTPGHSMYLLESGKLLRAGKVSNPSMSGNGYGGVVQLIDWDGDVTWEYEYSSTSHLQHHDVEMLPNGNVLMIAWQYKSGAEAIAAGRDPSLFSDELWPDSVIEVNPTTDEIVWEWHAWDHMIQDYDSSKENYAVVADHPELIDINFSEEDTADFNHMNSVDYNAELDQILVSVRVYNEVWVIDHSTTTEEAASSSGGTQGKGGDLLYRWGNPQVYGAGTDDDQKLFGQHDAEWIEDGNPGAGNIIVFNNGKNRPDGAYSTIEEFTPPLNDDGSYTLVANSAYGPAAVEWNYTADEPTDFYAQNLSGQQRLSNGNTLICNGPNAWFFEITAEGETVWEYEDTGNVFRVERYEPDYAAFDGTSLDDE